MNRFARKSTPPPQRPLTQAQELSLTALVALCPGLGEEATAAAVAAKSGLRHGATTLALRGLERRGMVTGHPDEDGPQAWAPTLTGRAHARHLVLRDGRAEAEGRHTRDE